MIPKPKWVGKINLQWFVHQYGFSIRNSVTSQSDNATFNKDQLTKLKVDIPDIKVQDQFVKKIRLLNETMVLLKDLEGRLYSLAIQMLT